MRVKCRTLSVSSLIAACSGGAKKRVWMAVFFAYFDASGDADDPACRVLSVAGWIAPETKWRRLEHAWKRVCDREGVSGLHMKDFAHSRREFEGWKCDEPRRQRFLGDLAKIIHHHTNREFSHTMFLDGYRAVNEQYELREHVGSPYAIGVWLSILAVQDWMKKTHPSDDVLFAFEKGDGDEGLITRQLKSDGIDLGVDPIFLKKHWSDDDGQIRTVPALECADFLAYEHAKGMTDVYLRHKTRARKSFFALIGPKHRWGVADGRFFEALVKKRRILRRAGIPPSPIPYEHAEIKDVLKR